MASITEILDRCLAARGTLFDADHRAAFRLFNGFTEGFPDLAADLYGATLLLSDHADPPESGAAFVQEAEGLFRERLPWLQAGILKRRHGKSAEEKNGILLFGEKPDEKIEEHGIWYSLKLDMHQDASFFLDTRNLRRWALDHLTGKTVLNAFAYTGSLGVAALAGGASRVVQLDRNRKFLDTAKASYRLNGFPAPAEDFLVGDFFREAGRLKRTGQLFDCVLLDPPFFSASSAGVVDQVHESARLINKVRPLINDGGLLVAINNALYVSGQDYLRALEQLCHDGYLEIAELIPVPDDIAGYPETYRGSPITDPTPFNHSTKIAVLHVRRKAGRPPAGEG